MLKCATIEGPLVVHVPYLDNLSLYMLLGQTTFIPPHKDVETDELEETAIGSEKHTEALDEPSVKPNIEDKGPKAEDIDITILVLCWNGGANSVEKLMKAFKMTHHQATLARKRIMECAEKHVAETEE